VNAHEPEGTRHWFCDSLGCSRRASRLRGDDFCAAGVRRTSPINHLCLNCEAIEEFTERSMKNGAESSERKAHHSSLHQACPIGPPT
jgi:hypothetical protein